MLKKRLITALWAIPLTAVIIWFGEPYFTIFLVVWGLLAIIEFYRLTDNLRLDTNIKISPSYPFGVIGTTLLIIFANQDLRNFINNGMSSQVLFQILFMLLLFTSLFSLFVRKQKSGAMTSWFWTLGGIIWVGLLLAHLVALRGIDNGRSWLFLAVFATFGSDSCAFLFGKTIGKHKLSPSISPGKTWEGSLGGLLGGVIVTLLFLLPTPVQLSASLNWWQAVILGLLVSVFGQLGDLSESLLKRNAGVKDSGKIFPGHGGVLDRMDSVVFAVVVVYYWVIWSIH